MHFYAITTCNPKYDIFFAGIIENEIKFINKNRIHHEKNSKRIGIFTFIRCCFFIDKFLRPLDTGGWCFSLCFGFKPPKKLQIAIFCLISILECIFFASSTWNRERGKRKGRNSFDFFWEIRCDLKQQTKKTRLVIRL